MPSKKSRLAAISPAVKKRRLAADVENMTAKTKAAWLRAVRREA